MKKNSVKILVSRFSLLSGMIVAALWLTSCGNNESKDTTASEAAPYAESESVEKVKQVLTSYKQALERLDTTGTHALFASNSQIIESGKVEGTYQNYLANHIGPELGHFTSFKFENYEVKVTLAGDYAFAVETYHYSIILKKDNSEIKRKGAASSFLKKEGSDWKILHMHNSSRKP